MIDFSKLKEVRFIYDNEQYSVKGDELLRFKENLGTMLHWADLHNYNLLRTNPVQYEVLPIEENNHTITGKEVPVTGEERTADEKAVIETPIKKAKKANPK